MDVTAFQSALEKGLGRAHLLLRRDGPEPYRDALLHACLHDLRYGWPCEGSREVYLFELIQFTGEASLYRRAILDALAAQGEKAEEYHLFEIALLFAQQGDAEARQVMYDAFTANAERQDYTGGDEIVRLDGLDGFLFVAERFVRAPGEWEPWHVRSWVSLLEEREGEGRAWQVVEAACAGDPSHAALLELVRAQRAQRDELRAPRKRPELDYAAVRQQIEQNGTKGLYVRLGYWGKGAREADLELAARDLLKEEDPERLRAYLWIFRMRRFPLDHTPLLTLAHNEDDRLSRAASDALSHVEHPTVRALAMELLDPPERYCDVVDLLRSNWRQEDEALVERLLETPQEPEGFHSLGLSVRDLLEEHPEIAGERSLLLLYEHGSCSLCRYGVVDLLIKKDRLPEWMREECAFDADIEIRKQVNELYCRPSSC